MTDSALQRARARALGGVQKVDAPASQPKAPTTSVRTVQLSDGTVVPEAYYDLDSVDQRRMVELVKQQERKKADDSAALQAASQLLDLRDKDSARVKALESQVSTLLGVVEAMQRRLDAKDNQLEIAKSEALAQQQVEVANTATNLLTVKLQADAEMQEFNRLREVSAAESRAALEAQATAIEALKGSVSSTTQLMAERSNTVLDQLSEMEPRVQQLAVQQTENANAIAANRQTLKAVTGVDLQSEIDLAVKRSFDDRLEGAMEALIERKYVTTAPTTGTDGYDPKPDDSAKPFLAEQQGDNATERAVNRALRKGKG